MPRPDIEGIEQREQAAPGGEWYYDPPPGIVRTNIRCGMEGHNNCGYGQFVMPPYHGDDVVFAAGQFIAHARQDIPALLDYIVELEAALVDAVDLARFWANRDYPTTEDRDRWLDITGIIAAIPLSASP